jgi:hypothetical protein
MQKPPAIRGGCPDRERIQIANTKGERVTYMTPNDIIRAWKDPTTGREGVLTDTECVDGVGAS